MKAYLQIDDEAHQHFEDVARRYRLLFDAPEDCRPMIIVDTPVHRDCTWDEWLADPLVMLRSDLDLLRPHLEIGDDQVPTVRVQFGSGLVAVAFGCEMVTGNGMPAAGRPILARTEDIFRLEKPALDAGWFGRLDEWTAIWKENLPPGIHIQHPDIQSAFNSAHLIRGSDLFLDLYDNPEDADALLDLVTDFMIDIIRHIKGQISDDENWFFDWGAMWKGFARISNCSMQMISPELYREHVLPRDVRFLEAVGGGRMHYCGTTGAVIDDFLRVPLVTGLDVDHTRHDFLALCERAPRHVVLIPTGHFAIESKEVKRFLAGDWPKKRNIVIVVKASSVDEGKDILARLRDSIPY